MTFPIVLVHGVCRFDVLWKDAGRRTAGGRFERAADAVHYFRGIRTHLLAHAPDLDVHHADLPWSASLATRAAALGDELRAILYRTGAEQLNLIAHSMGGLDTRRLLLADAERGRLHERIASVTTIATPHRGSPVADWAQANLSGAAALLARLGLDVGALADLTTTACCAFDDDPRVRAFETELARTTRLQSYAGQQSAARASGYLKATARIFAGEPNDGVVSVASATWRPQWLRGVIDDADHTGVIGWWSLEQGLRGASRRRFEERIRNVYLDIAQGLP